MKTYRKGQVHTRTPPKTIVVTAQNWLDWITASFPFPADISWIVMDYAGSCSFVLKTLTSKYMSLSLCRISSRKDASSFYHYVYSRLWSPTSFDAGFYCVTQSPICFTLEEGAHQNETSVCGRVHCCKYWRDHLCQCKLCDQCMAAWSDETDFGCKKHEKEEAKFKVTTFYKLFQASSARLCAGGPRSTLSYSHASSSSEAKTRQFKKNFKVHTSGSFMIECTKELREARDKFNQLSQPECFCRALYELVSIILTK
jgi:hypothetical protein